MKFNFDKGRVELFKNGYTQKQVDTINAIAEQATLQTLSIPQLAYCYATAYHECYNPRTPETRLTPIVEFGGETYLKSKKYYPYYGRGLSQLTWLTNYQKEEKRLKIPLISNPSLMLEIPTAANSHIYCMKNGSYTGKKLSDYINDKAVDFINARRIVNGTDKAIVIKGYAEQFLKCIER